VKEGAQKLTKTVSSAVEDEVERMRELREKIRAAERDRREREQQEAEARESRKAAAEREASVTRLSFDLDQFLYHVKKIEDDAFRFDYGGAVELLKRVRDVKESVPVLLAYLSGAAVKQFSHLNAEITEIATATARFVKDWQVRTPHTRPHTHDRTRMANDGGVEWTGGRFVQGGEHAADGQHCEAVAQVPAAPHGPHPLHLISHFIVSPSLLSLVSFFIFRGTGKTMFFHSYDHSIFAQESQYSQHVGESLVGATSPTNAPSSLLN